MAAEQQGYDFNGPGPQAVGQGRKQRKSKKMYRSYGQEEEPVSANIMLIVEWYEAIHMQHKLLRRTRREKTWMLGIHATEGDEQIHRTGDK